eukprot:14472037-Heterocapsa_arctica.AAC.1
MPNKSNFGVDKRGLCKLNRLRERPKQRLLPDTKWKYRKRSRNAIEWPKLKQEAVKNSYGSQQRRIAC